MPASAAGRGREPASSVVSRCTTLRGTKAASASRCISSAVSSLARADDHEVGGRAQLPVQRQQVGCGVEAELGGASRERRDQCRSRAPASARFPVSSCSRAATMPATPLGDGVGVSCTGLARAGSTPVSSSPALGDVEQPAALLVPVVPPDPVHDRLGPAEPCGIAGGLVRRRARRRRSAPGRPAGRRCRRECAPPRRPRPRAGAAPAYRGHGGTAQRRPGPRPRGAGRRSSSRSTRCIGCGRRTERVAGLARLELLGERSRAESGRRPRFFRCGVASSATVVAT